MTDYPADPAVYDDGYYARLDDWCARECKRRERKRADLLAARAADDVGKSLTQLNRAIKRGEARAAAGGVAAPIWLAYLAKITPWRDYLQAVHDGFHVTPPSDLISNYDIIVHEMDNDE